MFCEYRQRAAQHAFAAHRPELFGHVAANPRPASRGNNDGCDTCHVFVLLIALASVTFSGRYVNALRDQRILNMNSFLQCNTCTCCQNG
jgi:hypothetical protein